MSRDLSEYAPDGADHFIRSIREWSDPGDPFSDLDDVGEWARGYAFTIAHACRPTLLALERLDLAEAEVSMWKAKCIEGGMLLLEAMDMLAELQAERKEREAKS